MTGILKMKAINLKIRIATGREVIHAEEHRIRKMPLTSPCSRTTSRPWPICRAI
ncbi:MAG: hypothetical protein HZA49_02440 [Planctomycetes bacterium]|nr:hypothetical protein [Planctomycetota bacterium]